MLRCAVLCCILPALPCFALWWASSRPGHPSPPLTFYAPVRPVHPFANLLRPTPSWPPPSHPPTNPSLESLIHFTPLPGPHPPTPTHITPLSPSTHSPHLPPPTHTPSQADPELAAAPADLVRPEALDEARIEDLIAQHLTHNLEILPEQVGWVGRIFYHG